MGRTTIEQKKNLYKVTSRITYPEAINERELRAIAGGMFECLIPLSTEPGKKSTLIKSSVADMITLKTYFTRLISKKMFLDTVVRLIAIVKECERKSLNVNNLLLDPQYIFVDPRTKNIRCIFLPIVNNDAPYSAASFFRELPFGIVFTSHEDHSYIPRYLDYFKNNPIFSINSFEKLVLEMAGKKADKTYIPTGGMKTGDTGGFSSKAEEPKANPANIAYNPLSQGAVTGTCHRCRRSCPEGANFCPACGADLARTGGTEDPRPAVAGAANAAGGHAELAFAVHSGQKETQSFSETTVLRAADFGGTTVLGSELFSEPVFPYLIREKTKEKIIVNKPSYRIGKEKRYCDYFVSDNNAVSRSHADIITMGGRYYIIDQNSTNKTYVDGRAIPVQKEIELFSGTKLRLGNEEFIFYL